MGDLPLITSPGFASAITGFPLLADPYTNITPFTYRDGLTYLQVQEKLREWLENTFTPGIDANMTALQGAWDTEAAAIINAVNAAINTNNTDVTGMVTQVNVLVASLNTAITSASTSASNAATSAAAAAASAASSLAVTASAGDDTARINSTLSSAASFGTRKTVRFVGDFTISAPIVVPSNVTADFRDATITEKANTNNNMLVNQAVNTNKRTIYAAMTSGNAILTATATNESIAAAPFDVSDVGKPVIVQGAGLAGAPLVSTVASFQSSSQITLSAPASTTVTGQYATVGARDTNIVIIGGVWNRAGNGPNGSYLAHTMRFRHVDGLIIKDVIFKSTGGKYSVNPGDCNNVFIDTVYAPLNGSDVVHVNGPAKAIVISHIIGDSINDDLVSLTAGDSTGGVNSVRDVAGDITDVEVDAALFKVATFTASALKIIAGKTMDNSVSYAVRRVRAKSLTGPTTTAPVVYIGDTSGGIYDDIRIDGVKSLGGASSGCVIVHGGESLDRITLTNLVPDPLDSYAVNTDVSVGRLDVSGIKFTATTGAPIGVKISAGTVTNLLLRDVHVSAPNGAAVRVNAGAGVVSALLSSIFVAGGFGCITVVGGTLGYASLNGVVSTGSDAPINIDSVTTLNVSNMRATGLVNCICWVKGSGALTIVGWEGVSNDKDIILGVYSIAVKSSLSQIGIDPDRLSSGAETMQRLVAQATPQLNSGTMALTFFTARRPDTVTKIKTVTSSTAAAGTTLARMGLYTVSAAGDIALVASTANDVALWGSTFGSPLESLSASYTLIAGQRYALGVLFVGTTAPKLSGHTAASGAVLSDSPRLTAQISGQSDLPASYPGGSLGTSGGVGIYASLLP